MKQKMVFLLVVVATVLAMTGAPALAQCVINPGGCGVFPGTPVYDPYCVGNPQIGFTFSIAPGGPLWWWASVSNFHLFGFCGTPWWFSLPSNLSCSGMAVSCAVWVNPLILGGPTGFLNPNLSFQIPNDPQLVGAVFCYQTASYVVDISSIPPTCWTLTKVLRITIY